MSNESAPSPASADATENLNNLASPTSAITPATGVTQDSAESPTSDVASGSTAVSAPEDNSQAHASAQVQDSATSQPAPKQRRTISYFKGFLLAALLGCLAGILLAYPTFWVRNTVSDYMDTREQIAKYGEELPDEIRTILLAYHQLHDNFYSEISTYDLLNGALVSINASIAIEKQKQDKDKGTQPQTGNKDGKAVTNPDAPSEDQAGQRSHKLTEKLAPEAAKNVADKLDRATKDSSTQERTAKESNAKDGNAKESNAKDGNAKDGNAKDGNAKDGNAKSSTATDDTNKAKNGEELTLAQAYQEYATALADSVKSADVEIVYPLLPKDKRNSSDDDLVQQFTVIMLRVLREKKISREDACYSAVSGMTMATADPYTVAMDKEETRSLNEAMGNEDFCGIGAYLEASREHDKMPTVIEPLEDTPAAKAGLLPGDVITSIDGKATKGVSLELAVKQIRGPAGSQVVLTIMREGKPRFDVTITRAKVSKKSVVAKMVGNKAGYIRLRYFGRDTGKDCRHALLDLQSKHAEGIVLDMRNNSGGAIMEAVLVASEFLPQGALVTTVDRPRTGNKEEYNSVGSSIPTLPLVVLVNGYSASASEIVAGALKDSQRGLLVGETTFGKGSVQVFNSIGSDMSMKYTIAHYLTPSGHDINLKGINPDVECKAPFSNRLGDDNDIQLKEALKQLELRKKHQ